MTPQSQPEPRTSRLDSQPAPQPVDTAVPDDSRPTYEELQTQAAGADFTALAPHLDAQAREALGLPAAPAPLTIDRATADRARDYFIAHPDRIAALPDRVRDLLAL
ncbi:hypothetical protein [Streptacidiphilus sp. EB103A]|uniref:hypothetical protein n=1 Tax=Streptacidiphilus sp. EB103A TaxID=3156275 RepID=UPI0035115D44